MSHGMYDVVSWTGIDSVKMSFLTDFCKKDTFALALPMFHAYRAGARELKNILIWSRVTFISIFL